MANELITIERELEARLPVFEQVLNGIMPPERLARTVLISIDRDNNLLACSPQSILNAAMTFAVLGLEVDGVTGQGFMIKFANRAQPVIGYKGYNTLAARAGLTVTGSVVREGDKFDIDKGQGIVSHKPSLDGGGRIIGAWSRAAANDRPSVVEWLSISDLNAVKARSPAVKAGKRDTPWNDPQIGFPAMCEKTVKRRLARSMPLSVYQLGARMDEAHEEQGKGAWIDQTSRLHIEGERGAIVDAEPAEPPAAEALLGRRSANIAELERVAQEDGLEAVLNIWRLLPPAAQNEIEESERDRIRGLAEASDKAKETGELPL